MLQLKKLSMDFIFLERIVITPSVEVDDVTGSSMLSPAQSPGPTSIFTLGLGGETVGVPSPSQQHSIHASAE